MSGDGHRARICVIGAGRWGTNHVRTLDQLGSLGAIVDSRVEVLEAFNERYPGAATFRDVEQALDTGYDGFVVATPAETHHRIAAQILERGKPVLVEKPLALDAEGARDLARRAARSGVTLMVGHVLLFHPAVRKIKQLVEEGKIGKLQYLYSNRLNLGTVRTEENILWSFAPHDISIFQHLIGRPPRAVVSRGGAFIQPHLHDSTMTVLEYPDNVVGHVFVSWLHPYKEHRLVLIGSKGMLSFEDSSEDKNILFYEKGIDWVHGEPVRREGPTEVIAYDRAMPLTEELRYFIDRLEGPEPELAGAASAVEVLEILERATRSLLGDAPQAPGEAGARPSHGAPTAAEPTAPDHGRGAGGERAGEDDFYVHPTSIVDDGVEIGRGTRIWHFSHVQSGASIGAGCSLGQNVYVGSRVKIGDHVKIQNNVSVYEGVELEDYVFCGPSMVFTNVVDPRSKYPQRGAEHYRPTLVREGATIGANATVVCNHTIGRHAFVAAGAVVTRDVADHALVAGVPARRVGWVCECGKVLGELETGRVDCRCGRFSYRLEDEDRLVPDV